MCVRAQSCLTLCDPMDCGPPGSPHGILQARVRSGLPCPPPGDLPYPRIEPTSPALQVDSLPLSHLSSSPKYIYMYTHKYIHTHKYIYIYIKTCEPFWLIWKCTVFCRFTDNIIALMNKRLKIILIPLLVTVYQSECERYVMPLVNPKHRRFQV